MTDVDAGSGEKGPSLLKNRSLGALLFAELISLTGSQMTFVALPWFVLATTGSAARMGYVLAAELLPIGILGIPAGSLIARLGAKRTMLVSDAARAPLMALVPILHWTGNLSFVALLAIVFAIGCFLAPYFASSRLVLPEVVGEDEQLVAQGAAFVGGATQVTAVAGPLLAGLLIAFLGAPEVLLIDACSFVVSFAIISTLVRAGRRRAADPSSKGLLAGVRYVFLDRLLRPTLLAAAGLNFVSQGLVATLPVLTYRRYDADAKIVGFLFGSVGAGALVGSLVAANLVRQMPVLRLARWAIIAMAVPLWLLPIPMPFWAVGMVLAAFGFFSPLVNAPLIGVLTVRTPEAVRAKVMTAVMTISLVIGPLGLLAAGQSLQHVGVNTVFLVVAAGFTVGCLAFAAALARGDEEATAEAGPAAARPQVP